MKKSSMHTIIAYMYTILFQLYGSKAGVFEDNLFWEGKYDPPPLSNLHIERAFGEGQCDNPTFILKEELIQY